MTDTTPSGTKPTVTSKANDGAWCAEHGSTWKVDCPSCEGAIAARVAARTVQNVCELPDYNSPEDQPDLVMCTVQELENCVLRAFEAHGNETPDQLRNATLDYVLHVHKPERSEDGTKWVYVTSPTVPGLHAVGEFAERAVLAAAAQVSRLREDNAHALKAGE